MARDWDAEWKELLAEQDEASSDRQEAYAEITAILGRSGAPTVELTDRVKAAHENFEASKRKIEEWLREWWASER